jgi:hypothetical protein
MLDVSTGPTPAPVPAPVAPFTDLRVPPAPDAVPTAAEAVFETVPTAPEAVFETVPTAPEAVFETVPTAPEAVFETGSVAPETVFETGSVAPETVFETGSVAPETVFETGSVAPETVFAVSTGSGVVLVMAETTGAGSIGTSTANACDAHPTDTTTTVAHMIEKRCAPMDPFAMTRLPDGRPCSTLLNDSLTPPHVFLTRKL